MYKYNKVYKVGIYNSVLHGRELNYKYLICKR